MSFYNSLRIFFSSIPESVSICRVVLPINLLRNRRCKLSSKLVFHFYLGSGDRYINYILRNVEEIVSVYTVFTSGSGTRPSHPLHMNQGGDGHTEPSFLERGSKTGSRLQKIVYILSEDGRTVLQWISTGAPSG